MRPHLRVVAVALGAAVLGAAAGLWFGGPGPLLRTELGQRALHGAMSATAPTPPDGVPVAERGKAVPTVRAQRLDGAPLTLPGDFAGRPVLVNLWASWCGPCIEEMPELERFAQAQGANGVQVVGIALDEADAVRAFLQRVPVTYAIALDAPGPRDAGVQLGNTRGVLPYTALIDARGRLVKQKIGPFQPGEIDDWAAEAIQTTD
ncbi:TlpA family protein disulfide reductase [Cognatilysobacter bugurensis]|uniref:Thioredoxin n=1 Tax=Cognatilysobacter bugurensis TaxID=543356 RepID=A0A918W9S4_9GAMM|nr:TlpA disulfide reductase family protein [Lysobacter bugurensis]GHA80869.1 thioredoxin [Lysobacter bugurensis]